MGVVAGGVGAGVSVLGVAATVFSSATREVFVVTDCVGGVTDGATIGIGVAATTRLPPFLLRTGSCVTCFAMGWSVGCVAT